MSNTWVAKIKASLLMSAQCWIFSNTSSVHPAFQPLSCSFIHLPNQVPTSSNIHVRHVTKIHAAGEGQLHHSSLLVSCQSGIKPTVNVGWKSERFGWRHRTSWPVDICHYIIKSISISRINKAKPMQQLLLQENKLHRLRCSKPCTFPLSSVGDTYQFGLRLFITLFAWCCTFSRWCRFSSINPISLESYQYHQGGIDAVISPVSYSNHWDTAFQCISTR